MGETGEHEQDTSQAGGTMSNSMISNEPLGKQLVFTAKAVREAFEDTLHLAGGSLGTWVVLSALSDEGIISQSALGSHVHLEGATITHHVDRLEKLGLVRRQADPTKASNCTSTCSARCATSSARCSTDLASASS